MGGGGFSEDDDDGVLDDHLLSLVPSRSPKVCFVPTASGDADAYIQRFLTAFPESRADASVLRLFMRESTDLRKHVLAQDVIYVGGGSTANLLAVWRVHAIG